VSVTGVWEGTGDVLFDPLKHTSAVTNSPSGPAPGFLKPKDAGIVTSFVWPDITSSCDGISSPRRSARQLTHLHISRPFHTNAKCIGASCGV
jgi:hypothetical protein